jgi:hypothetical protein
MVQPQALETTAKAMRAIRQQQAHELALKGLTYRQIGAQLNISRQTVMKDLRAHWHAMVGPLAEERRQLEDARLDAMQEALMDVLNAEHFVVSEGRIVYDERGCAAEVHVHSSRASKKEAGPYAAQDCVCRPLRDTGPVLKAIGEWRKVSESRRKLWGLDIPVKQEIEVTRPVEDPDAELARLWLELQGQTSANSDRQDSSA